MNRKRLRKIGKNSKGDFKNPATLSDMQEEKLEVGNKCGDVFFRSDIEKFSLICGLCELSFESFKLFSQHFLVHHLSEWDDRNIEVKLESVDILYNEEEGNDSNNSFNLFSTQRNDDANNMEKEEDCPNFKKNDAFCENMDFENVNNKEETSNKINAFMNEKDPENGFAKVFVTNLVEDFEENEKFKFECKYCKTKLETRKLYLEHLRKCNLNFKKTAVAKGRVKFSKNELTCDICNRELPNISSLLRHKTSHIENSKRPFKCKICFKGFNTAKHLEKHSKVHDEPRIYECDFCFMKFNSIASKNGHQRKHSIDYRHLVETIGKKMAVLQQIKNGNSENLVLEINYSVPDGYWRCDVCDKMFKNSYKPEEHKRFHNEVKPFICELCGKGMASQQILNHHILVHKEERRFKCSKCGTSFFTSAHLKRHEQTTCNSQKLFQCEICQYRFTRKEHLTAHSLTHEKNRSKDFKCEYCNAGYLTSNSLRVHKKKHMVTTDGPFKCSLCSAVFSNKEAIKRHEKRHQNKGAFKCEHCNKRFNDKDDMQQHTKRQHFSEIKPYSCVNCNKSFMKKSDLKEHFTTHNGS